MVLTGFMDKGFRHLHGLSDGSNRMSLGLQLYHCPQKIKIGEWTPSQLLIYFLRNGL